MSHLSVSPDCLLFFADDTGHEALIPGQLVYGLGGCAVMAKEVDQIIRGPWQKVRESVSGSGDAPLHANEFSRTARREDIEAVAAFFRQQQFARFGAIISESSSLPSELSPMQAVAKALQNRIIDVARWTSFREIMVIFEASERADRLIEQAFQGFALEENGKPIPVECCFMPKSVAEPALEVADFIMHAVGRQARQNLTQRGTFALDFKAVFHSVDAKLASFIEIDKVTRSEPAAALSQ